MNIRKKKILVIGGGTGTYTVLSGLREFPVDLGVIVSMMDDGGSNRVIRDEFGLLPTSDIRQCIVALSKQRPNDLIRKLFTYRFNSGVGISGMTFGNLFMAALTDIYGSQKKAIEKTCEFLKVKGKIIPVTYEKTNLVALYSNGSQVLGEHEIDEPPEHLAGYRIVEIGVFPKVKANPKAIQAINEADLVVLGPGDLYTSVLPNLVIEGVAQALRKAKAKVIFVMNLMTRWGQTNNYTAYDFFSEVEKYLVKGRLDYVLVNKGKIPKKALEWYKRVKSVPVKDDLEGKVKAKVIRGDFVSNKIYTKTPSDTLTRSLVRHDSAQLAKAIISLI